MEPDLSSVFNRLAKADQLKLKGAAMSKAITGLVRDDTRDKPWRYPFYALYLLVVATPLPVWGASTLVIAATVAWAKWEMSPLAKELNRRLKESFNEAALVEEHKDYIVPHPDTSEKYRVKNLALAWHTTKKACEDSWQATRYAWQALKKFTMG